ncbi:MAG TPA: glycosyltransferase family 2 protein [Solirubrobacterales bacterium]|nr:glycosyltransferase family 2 protein [Solirubrobacterales bacterium]
MSAPGIDAVIVSYRSKELLGRCLDSLREHLPGEGSRIIVVDNASGDGTPEMVASTYPDVELLAQDSNIGFGAATNIGIAVGDNPYVLALNPDAAIEADTVGVLVDLMESNSRIGCAGPALYQEDGTFDHAARRSFPTPLSALGHFTGVGRALGGGRLADYRAPEVDRGEVDAVNGAFMLLRRAALEEVGVFDEGYWMYMEDLDLNYRLAREGWLTWYEPSVRAIHSKGGTTGGRRDARLQIAFHRGMGRFYRKHYAPGSSELANLAIYAGIGLKLGVSLTRGALSGRRR